MTTVLDFLSGGSSAYAFDVNADGLVVGFSSDGTRDWAVSWTGTIPTALTDLTSGTSSWALGVNDDGDIVGYCIVGGATHAVIWPGGGAPTDLGSPTELGAIAIDSSGHPVGATGTAPVNYHAAIWTPTLTDLGLGQARSVNVSDDVVGFSGNDPIIWPAAGSPVDLGFPSGTAARAEDVNAGGDVVGWISDPSPNVALVWPGGSTAVELDPLTPGNTAIANGINDNDIVGSGQAVDSNFYGVIWPSAGSPIALDPIDGGSTFGQAESINASGVIVGGSDATDGFTHAVIFTYAVPVTPPTPFLIEDSFYEELGVE